MAKSETVLRGGDIKSVPGEFTFTQAEKSDEQTIRGGSGTSQKETGKTAGGDFNPTAAANGYPSNK
jgi:hypothetical protein